MFHASPYVFQNQEDDDELVNDEELERGLADTVALDLAPLPPPGAGEAAAAPAPPVPQRTRQRRKKKSSRKRAARNYRRQVDTNVISVKLNTLAEDAVVATGEATVCEECGAILNCESTVTSKDSGAVIFKPQSTAAAAAAGASTEAVGEEAKAAAAEAEGKAEPEAAALAEGEGEGEGDEEEDGDQVWVCEFCSHTNICILDEEELPSPGVGTVNYLLAPPPPATLGRQCSANNNIVVFCVDVSGSMCVTTEVEGRLQLKGERNAADSQSLAREFGDGGGQFLPGQRRDVTYVSRLQSVQAAVAAQLEAMAADTPDRQVALITFNGQVTVIGDGTQDPRVIAGDRLSDWDDLERIGGECNANLGRIGDTHAALSEKLFALEETGPTALGPAMVVAASLASAQPASKVILCTDGLANVGLGALDGDSEELPPPIPAAADDAAAAAAADAAASETVAEAFYRRVSDFASAAGITIDVIGIEGDGCDLEHLGVMADATAGTVQKVNPLQLTRNFSSILALPVVATNVTATLLLHRGLQFRATEGAEGSSKLARDIGNVTAESEVTFEYSMKSAAQLAALGATNLKALPFQLQLHYKRLDGAQYVRVISQSKPITNDRRVAEAEVNVNLLGTHVAQQCANMAQIGDYTESRVNAFAWGKLMQRNVRTVEARSAYGNFVQDMDGLDRTLQLEEDAEEEEGLVAAAPAAAAQQEGSGGLLGGIRSLFGGGGGGAAAAAASAPAASRSKAQLRRARKNRRAHRDDLSSALYSHKKTSY